MAMVLYVRVAATGVRVPVDVEADWTVLDVKWHVEEAVGCSVQDQVLLLEGDEVEGDLCTSGVCSEAELVLVSRTPTVCLYGGAETFVAVTEGNLVSWGKHNIKSYNVKYPVISLHSLIVVKTNFHVLITEGDHQVQLHDASEVVRVFNLNTSALLIKASGTALLWPSTSSLLPLTTITKPITDIATTCGSCTTAAALLEDGSVFTCGNPLFGGDPQMTGSLRGIKKVVGFGTGFVAVTATDKILVWGIGCEVPPRLVHRLTDVVDVVTTYGAVAAMHKCGRVTVWGSPDHGGQPSAEAAAFLETSVVKVYATHSAFCALNKKGYAVAWGSPHRGGSVPPCTAPVLRDVVTIACTLGAFAALMTGGRVVCWGSQRFGGEPDSECQASLARDVCSVVANNKAFAAVKQSGEVVAWGAPSHGGETCPAARAFSELFGPTAV